MSGVYGANPQQLADLGRSLRSQIESVNAVIGTVTSALNGTTWTGPARDQFENEWHTSFRSALNRLNDSFEAAGQSCISRSSELERVMGTGAR